MRALVPLCAVAVILACDEPASSTEPRPLPGAPVAQKAPVAREAPRRAAERLPQETTAPAAPTAPVRPGPDWREAEVGDRVEYRYTMDLSTEEGPFSVENRFSLEVVRRDDQTVWAKLEVAGRPQLTSLIGMALDPAHVRERLAAEREEAVDVGPERLPCSVTPGERISACRSGAAPLYLLDGVVWRQNRARGGTTRLELVSQKRGGTGAGEPADLPRLVGPDDWFRLFQDAGRYSVLEVHQLRAKMGLVEHQIDHCSRVVLDQESTGRTGLVQAAGRWFDCRPKAPMPSRSVLELVLEVVGRTDDAMVWSPEKRKLPWPARESSTEYQLLDFGHGPLPSTPAAEPLVEELRSEDVWRRLRAELEQVEARCVRGAKPGDTRVLAALRVAPGGTVADLSLTSAVLPQSSLDCLTVALRKLRFPKQSRPQPLFLLGL